MLRSTSVYDRTRVLKAAARARSKRRRKKAIALYRWVLAVEPGNAEIHGKLAPLLARTGQTFDAWVSYRRAARGLAREGLTEKALGIYREEGSYLPRQLETWLAIFELERQRGRDADAREALLEGRRRFRGRRFRPQAIYLLRRMRTVDPWELETVLDLSRLLVKTGQRREAEMLLREMGSRCRGRAAARAHCPVDDESIHRQHLAVAARHVPDGRKIGARPSLPLAARAARAGSRISSAR